MDVTSFVRYIVPFCTVTAAGILQIKWLSACVHCVFVCMHLYRTATAVTSASHCWLDTGRGVTVPCSSSGLSEQLLCYC